MQLILASSSKSRAKQISQLKLPFKQIAPEIDETQKVGESPNELVLRLASAKAAKIAETVTDSIVIAGDQIHLVDGNIHGKPKTAAIAEQQLRLASGKTTEFISGIAVYNTQTKQALVRLVTTEVTFRNLSITQIRNYIALDQPFECAGSIRIEGLAPCLIKNISAPDPTAITGMPLIVCCEMLAAVGFDCLEQAIMLH